MIFANLPPGASVFVDANTWVYHFTSQARFGSACTVLIARIGQQDIAGFTSTHVMTEVAHRLILVEASAANGWPLASALKRLQKNPLALEKLSQFRIALDELLQTGIQLLAATPQDVLAAASVSQQTGLLSNDGLIVAIMQAHGLVNLASGDSDFDRVPGITRYGPA